MARGDGINTHVPLAEKAPPTPRQKAERAPRAGSEGGAASARAVSPRALLGHRRLFGNETLSDSSALSRRPNPALRRRSDPGKDSGHGAGFTLRPRAALTGRATVTVVSSPSAPASQAPALVSCPVNPVGLSPHRLGSAVS